MTDNEKANLDIVHAAYQAFIRAEPAKLLNIFAPQVEMIMPSTGSTTAALWHGRDGVVRYFALATQCEIFEPREYLTNGDRIVVLGRLRRRDRATGQVVEKEWVHLVTMRDHLVTRLQVFEDTPHRAFQTPTQVHDDEPLA